MAEDGEQAWTALQGQPLRRAADRLRHARARRIWPGDAHPRRPGRSARCRSSRCRRARMPRNRPLSLPRGWMRACASPSPTRTSPRRCGGVGVGLPVADAADSRCRSERPGCACKRSFQTRSRSRGLLAQFVQTARTDLGALERAHAAGTLVPFGRLLHRFIGACRLLNQREVAGRAGSSGVCSGRMPYARRTMRISGPASCRSIGTDPGAAATACRRRADHHDAGSPDVREPGRAADAPTTSASSRRR